MHDKDVQLAFRVVVPKDGLAISSYKHAKDIDFLVALHDSYHRVY